MWRATGSGGAVHYGDPDLHLTMLSLNYALTYP